MATKQANRILLDSDNEAVYTEAIAAGTIKPGYLCELDSAGKFAAHSTAKGWAQRYFALEDALQGKTVTDDYSADDLVQTVIPQRGSRVQVVIAASQTIVKGDGLISAGDGTLQKVSGTADLDVIAFAETAITTTAAVDYAIARIR